MSKQQFKEKVLLWLAENNIFPKRVRVYELKITSSDRIYDAFKKIEKPTYEYFADGPLGSYGSSRDEILKKIREETKMEI